MCDTFVTLGKNTSTGSTLLAKNSDREPNEAQEILHVAATKHSVDTVKCTYISIPQSEKTYEVILSKPFHMWGAEMGCNEHGVAIGNEALFTNIKKERINLGLTGMDILRLALERSQSAKEALDICCGLIEKYGQNACGGYQDTTFFYDNSFIIADPTQAWKLESAGRHWAAKKIHNFDSISNGISIEDDYDLICKKTEKDFVNQPATFSFRKTFENKFMSKMSKWKFRQACTFSSLAKNKGDTDINKAIEILSSHENDQYLFNPTKSSPRSVCMHASGLLNPSQTTGSMVAELIGNKRSVVWLTGTSMPCLSIYKPFFFGTQIDNLHPTARPNDSLWWQAEKLHRWIAADYPKRVSSFKAKKKNYNKRLFMKLRPYYQMMLRFLS